MAMFSTNTSNDGNKLTIPLGSQISLIEDLVPQFVKVAIDATNDAQVIEFDQGKYNEFFPTNSFNKYKSTFCATRKVTCLP